MKKHSITTLPPGPNAKSVLDNMRKVSYDSTFNYPLVIANGYGMVIENLDGNRYLDFTSNIGVCPLGYSHPEITKELSKYSKIGIRKIAGQDFYCKEHLAIAEKVVSIIPKNFKTFFVNSGTEAVENAIKIAYKKMGALSGISCINAFHGRTLGALSFTFSKAIQKANFPELSVKRTKFCTDTDVEIDSIEKLLKG
jgi:4-aminobutyrate aminotransferase